MEQKENRPIISSRSRQKMAVRQVQLTPREDEEYQWAQDTRLNQYYNKEVVGLNDELNDVGLDKHSNPSGSSFDLGQDGQFSEFTVLIGGFVSGASMGNPVQALKKKGFQVILENSEKGFLSQLKIADVAWVISGTDPNPKPSRTSSKESYPAWNSVNRKEFQEEINKYHKSGGGLFLWGDNDPLFEHANAALQRIFQDEEMVLIGNTPANKILDVGDGKLTGQFHPHIITSGIVKLYEGVTICYPKKTSKLKILATSTDGNPAICYADNEILQSDSCGRIVIDCGYTKNYFSWNEAGAARYIINATIWLLALEHRLKIGADLRGRRQSQKQ